MKGFKVRIISVASSSLSDYCGEIEFSTKPPQSEEEEKGRRGEALVTAFASWLYLYEL
jgi:hypothetical protein